MKKYLSLIFSLLCCILLFTACGQNSSENTISVYYVRTDKTGLEPENIAYSGSSQDAKIQQILNALGTPSDAVEFLGAIPNDVEVSEWKLSNGDLTLYLSGDYYALDNLTQVLSRAAIVKTLTQIDGLDTVTIYVNDQPLVSANGTALGTLSADMFIEDFGQETDSLLSTDLNLYFSSADGTTLMREKRKVYYSSNVTLEKVVLEELMDGPQIDNAIAAIPAGTKLNSVSVTDGICYVNFDSSFETAIAGVTENVTVYSIVNSLAELDNISQVQILVNGETAHLANVDMDLSGPLSPNRDLLY